LRAAKSLPAREGCHPRARRRTTPTHHNLRQRVGGRSASCGCHRGGPGFCPPYGTSGGALEPDWTPVNGRRRQRLPSVKVYSNRAAAEHDHQEPELACQHLRARPQPGRLQRRQASWLPQAERGRPRGRPLPVFSALPTSPPLRTPCSQNSATARKAPKSSKAGPSAEIDGLRGPSRPGRWPPRRRTRSPRRPSFAGALGGRQAGSPGGRGAFRTGPHSSSAVSTGPCTWSKGEGHPRRSRGRGRPPWLSKREADVRPAPLLGLVRDRRGPRFPEGPGRHVKRPLHPSTACQAFRVGHRPTRAPIHAHHRSSFPRRRRRIVGPRADGNRARSHRHGRSTRGRDGPPQSWPAFDTHRQGARNARRRRRQGPPVGRPSLEGPAPRGPGAPRALDLERASHSSARGTAGASERRRPGPQGPGLGGEKTTIGHRRGHRLPAHTAFSTGGLRQPSRRSSPRARRGRAISTRHAPGLVAAGAEGPQAEDLPPHRADHRAGRGHAGRRTCARLIELFGHRKVDPGVGSQRVRAHRGPHSPLPDSARLRRESGAGLQIRAGLEVEGPSA